MPDDMPESYCEMLEGLLTYRHKRRKSAKEMLTSDFVQFHKDLEEEGKDEIQDMVATTLWTRKERMSRTSSIAVRGSAKRHSIFLDFKKFERSVTTILATMLNREQLGTLLSILKERFENGDSQNPRLQVISIRELKDILKHESNNTDWYVRRSKIVLFWPEVMKHHSQHSFPDVASVHSSLRAMEKLADGASYESFAYNTAFLREFAPGDERDENEHRAPPNRKDSLQKKASVWQMTTKPVPGATPIVTDATGTTEKFSLSRHASISSFQNTGRKGMERAQSCFINSAWNYLCIVV
jgi:hypothetical protein